MPPPSEEKFQDKGHREEFLKCFFLVQASVISLSKQPAIEKCRMLSIYSFLRNKGCISFRVLIFNVSLGELKED